MEVEPRAARKKYIGLRKTAIWWLISSVALSGLWVLGVTSDNPAPYVNWSDTTPWWSRPHEGILIGSFFALVIPLPNVLIACLFRSKRTWASVLKIYRGWYIGMSVLALASGLMLLLKTNSIGFCAQILASEKHQTFLKQFHESNVKNDGESLRLGKLAKPYKVYSNCTENNDLYKCWSGLGETDVRTNRELYWYHQSIGVVLYECQSKTK
jgi:hypothetical protein